MKPVAMVGWSGAGSFADLEKTAARKLGAASKADRIDGSLIFESNDPVDLARQLGFLPGVAWIAVGYRFKGMEGYLRQLELLGKRYLRKGTTFAVSARVEGSSQSVGDYVLSGNSALLSSVKGTKVKEGSPSVRFRVCVGGEDGACGVEIRSGPSGKPTSGERVAVLVSGGTRSAYLAWQAALSGYAVRLIHSKTDETSMRQVARLYSELSFRIDPSGLELILLEGGGKPFARIGGWLRRDGGATFAGLRPEPRTLANFSKRFPNLSFPLQLVQEDVITSGYRSLELGPPPKAKRETLSMAALEAKSGYSVKKFGGVRADHNTVIDRLRR